MAIFPYLLFILSSGPSEGFLLCNGRYILWHAASNEPMTELCITLKILNVQLYILEYWRYGGKPKTINQSGQAIFLFKKYVVLTTYYPVRTTYFLYKCIRRFMFLSLVGHIFLMWQQQKIFTLSVSKRRLSTYNKDLKDKNILWKW